MPNYAEMFLANYKLNKRDVIYPIAKPLKSEGSMALLKGNLAPDGATIKKSAVVAEMMVHEGPARVFDSEKSAVDAFLNREFQPGDVIVIRYQGPRATGMPEMFYMSELIASDPVLSKTTALVTDGRFSGATRGPCIGYMGPEALDGGPIAFVNNGDTIRIDIPERRLDIVRLHGIDSADEQEIGLALEKRKSEWKRPDIRHKGALGQYTRLAKPALEGASAQA
ncbi:MAG: dihydroxy-acid dehydratase [Paenibacillus sp.]|nr:dihydroxy-acid dehydratase [Paenibacillus sp.]